MTPKVKYIKTKDNQLIVFPEYYQHSDFAHFEPISAGFVSIGVNVNGGSGYGETTISCYGESISLGLKSDKEIDSELANRQILRNGYF
mgnify:CR=1 FL=1